MALSTRHTAFDTAHPVVPAVFLAITLGLTMFSMHPVLIALSLAGGLAYSACLRGWRMTARSVRWQLPVVLLVALVNPLFVRMGATELCSLFGRPVYAESLWYGSSMAALFLASAQWFSAGSVMLSHDKVLGLLGNAAPLSALMLSMTMRLVPRFLRQGRTIASVQDVVLSCGDAGCGAPANTVCDKGALSLGASLAGPPEHRTAARRITARTLPAKAALRLRQSSVLMGWAMEDSLETADAMRARGWGVHRRRTIYDPHRLTARDGILLALLVGIGALCAWVAWDATASFTFYPQLAPLAPGPGYLPYAAWMSLPSALHIYENRRFA